MSDLKTPEIGDYLRRQGRLVEVQDVTPVQQPVFDYIFEDTEARIEARANGHLVRTYTTFNDFYGEGTCVESAIKEAKQLHAKLGDGLELVVVKRTSRTRRRPHPHHGSDLYNPGFLQFESIGTYSRVDLPEPVEEVVWSSKREARA